jgi:hypothetical protein
MELVSLFAVLSEYLAGTNNSGLMSGYFNLFA